MLAKTPEEMGENIETFLDALNAFERKPSREIPSELEQLLCRIARNGEPLFPWTKLKPLVVTKLENVIQEYIQSNPCEEVPMLPNVENVKFDDMRERLLRALNAFNSAPFTMQRLCELLTHPKRYYQRSDKFMRGVEKNVQVVSTVTPTGKRITHSCEVRNRNLMMNGIPSDMHTQTSTPSAEAQTSEEPASSDEAGQTNGTEALPTSDETASPAQEQSVDSTLPTASESEPAASELVNTNERTTSGGDMSPASTEEKEETPSSNEAEACKPLELGEQATTGDSDDSDGVKGDADQDSCSSMDSADSGDSSPDSALPPRTGYFDTLPPKDTDAAMDSSSEKKDSEFVESTTDSERIPTEDKSAPDTVEAVTPEQSHSSINNTTQPDEPQQPCPLATPTAAVAFAHTRTDQSEEAFETAGEGEPNKEEESAMEEGEEEPEATMDTSANQTESSSEVDQSDDPLQATSESASMPMEQE